MREQLEIEDCGVGGSEEWRGEGTSSLMKTFHFFSSAMVKRPVVAPLL